MAAGADVRLATRRAPDDCYVWHLTALALRQHFLRAADDGSVCLMQVVGVNGKLQSTALLFRASLVVYVAFRSTRLGAHVRLQLIAEALAGATLLTDSERARIFDAARVNRSMRTARVAALASLDDFNARIQHVLDSPTYDFQLLAPLGSKKKRLKNRKKIT